MEKDRRTKPQLLDEVRVLRRRVAHLEGLEGRAGAEGPEHVQAKDLETLFAVARDLAGPGGMEEKATKVLRRIADVMDAEWVVLRLLDEEAQVLRLVSFVGAGLDELPPLPVLRRGQLISGQAFEQRRALVVNDYGSHAGADPARIAQGMKSGVSLVLTAEGRMVGTLQVSSSTRDHFTAERVRFLTAIADGMGALLENARLLEAVRDSEERYRTLFEQSRDAIYMTSDGRLVDVNEAALRMFGYTREDVLKIDLDDLFADPADRRLRHERLARFGAVEDFETLLLRCDGTEFHCVITSWQRKAADGTPVGTAGIIRDISERKQAEEEARLRTQELEALFSVASLLVGPGTFGDKARDVLEEVARVVEADTVILRLADDEQQGLRLVATAGEGLQNPEPPPLLPYGELLSGEAFEQGRPIIANDYASRETAEAARVARGIKSAIALPIESGGHILGSVVVSSLVADHFTARRVRLLTAIANDMGVLLDNARLLERTRESEERYRSLFEHSKEAIFIAREHQMVEVNQAGLDLLGYTSDDVRGMNHEDMWVEPSAMQRMGQELSAKGSVQDFEVKLRRKDGAVIDCAITMTQYRSDDGTLLGEEGIIHDITERKRAEELFRIVAESSPVAVFLVQDQTLSFVNQQFESILGYTADEIIGQEALSLVVPDDRQTVQDNIVRVLDGEPLQTFEYRAHNKAGDVVWVLGTCALIDYDGKPAMLGSFSDNTARKHAEEETRQLARENSVMAEIGRVIGSSLDVDAVYERFAEHVRELMPFDRIDITLPGTEPGTVMHAYQSGVKAPGRMRGDVYPLAGTATEDVLKTGEEMLFHPRDVDEVDERLPGLRPAFDSGLRSFMGIPLVTRNEVFGALFIASETRDAYSARDLSMAKRVGSQIAGAIANAQLYADRARAEQEQARLAQRLNLLNEIMRIAVSNLNVTEVFDGVSEQVKKLIDHDRLSIDLLTVGESSSELVPFVAVGFGAVDRGLSMPLASPVGEVVRTGKPILRGDLLRDGAYPIEAEFARTTGIRSAMFVPLASRDRVIGCLTFSSAQAGHYDERELDTAQTIADHLAVIVEHAQLYKETKRAEEQLRAINDVAVSTSSVLQLDDLLPYVTGLLHDTFGWDVVNVLLTDDKNENVVLRATLGHRDEAVAPGFKVDIGKQGIISWVAKTGEALLANDVSQEPRYHLNEARPHIKAELAVAIKQEDDVLGVLDIESERLHAFDRTDVSTAQSLANQLAVAIENARLFELARDLAVLEERNRMAREIHDTMAQGFTGIVLQLEAAEQAFEGTPSEIPDHLGRAKDLARTCLQEARRSVWNLLPRALEERPLSEALEKEVAQWTSDGPEEAHFTLSGVSRELDADIQAALLRICQESLTNIRKHAGASQASVQVTYLPSSVRLEIQDDGVGFDPNAKTEDGMQHGFGLLGMEQRARLIRGKLEVKTKQGHGTTISVEVPTG